MVSKANGKGKGESTALPAVNDRVDRSRIAPDVLKVIRSNAKGAVERLREIIEDDTAWGKDGWLPPNSQVKVAEAAMDRSFGRPEQVKVDEGAAGARINADSVVGIVEALYKRFESALPERQGSETGGKTVEAKAEPIEDAVEESVEETLRRRAAQQRERDGGAGATRVARGVKAAAMAEGARQGAAAQGEKHGATARSEGQGVTDKGRRGRRRT